MNVLYSRSRSSWRVSLPAKLCVVSSKSKQEDKRPSQVVCVWVCVCVDRKERRKEGRERGRERGRKGREKEEGEGETEAENRSISAQGHHVAKKPP